MGYFKGKCGEDYIERGDYSIATEDGRSVQCNNWGSVVKKGTVLVMSIPKKVALMVEKDIWRRRNVCPLMSQAAAVRVNG